MNNIGTYLHVTSVTVNGRDTKGYVGMEELILSAACAHINTHT